MGETKKKPGRPPGSKNKNKVSEEEQLRLQEELKKKKRIQDEIWAIVLIAVGVFLVISLQTEAAGQIGHGISLFFKGLFGLLAYVLPYYLILYGVLLFAKQTAHIGHRSVVLLAVIFLLACVLNSAHFLENAVWSAAFPGDSYMEGTKLESGGIFGMCAGLLLKQIIGVSGLYIVCISGILISLIGVMNTPISQFAEDWKIRREAKRAAEEVLSEGEENGDTSQKGADSASAASVNESEEKQSAAFGFSRMKAEAERKARAGKLKIIDYMNDDGLFERNQSGSASVGLEAVHTPEPGMGLDGSAVSLPTERENEDPGVGASTGLEEETIFRKSAFGNTVVPESIASAESALHKKAAAVEAMKIESPCGASDTDYQMPPIDLLAKAPGVRDEGEGAALKAKAEKLENTLHNFGVDAKVVQVTRGPAVTRYEIQPSVGVKVSNIVRLADDIALNLEAKSIRMEAPIPGKAAVGIEVENERINMVSVREIIESREFRNAKSKISFAVGKDISGTAVVADLKGMPHLLIAGSTGSGKSVCINTLITSILYKAKPEEVKFVLIDPKVVELGNYNGIPHLLVPVVTDASKAASALNWAVAEMTERYRKFAEEGVRDLASFNEKMKADEKPECIMPQIVIIIDELADLMMVAKNQVEDAICRLAQMARAAGMHLIVATQRPSVDVITGVIKANIPSRIAFAVSSQFDSRTIIDMGGAEKLVGKGDMLFSPLGISKPVRVQGAFISDTEVHNVIEFLKKQVPETSYSSDVMQSLEKNFDTKADSDEDELLQEAIETVVKAEQASTSMLQRRFRIGYNRAARLIDMMETRGIVGPPDGSRPRKVLLTEEEYLALGRDPGDDGVPEEI